MKLLKLIPKNKAKAIHCGTLASRLNVTPREVRAMVRDIRKEKPNGHFLLSNTNGYWLSNKPEEIAEFYERYYGEAKSMMSIAKNAKAVLSHHISMKGAMKFSKN